MILQNNLPTNNHQFKVAAFYIFKALNEEAIDLLLRDITSIANENLIKGTLLVASEGFNGTVSGSETGIDKFLERLKESVQGNTIELKISWAARQAFRRFKARRKQEIVTMGMKDIRQTELVGEYISPDKWNDLINDPETLVIDTRNDYEISVGTFPGAINPKTRTFREFPKWVDKFLRKIVDKKRPKNIAMFCTGGIRCEKATSYLKKEGFEGVVHLHGGILRYLEEVPQEISRWEGECFVFDQRVSLQHDLVPGDYKLCFACGMPLSKDEINNINYIRGIQCHHCINNYSDRDRARFAERQRQIDELSFRRPGNLVWPNS